MCWLTPHKMFMRGATEDRGRDSLPVFADYTKIFTTISATETSLDRFGAINTTSWIFFLKFMRNGFSTDVQSSVNSNLFNSPIFFSVAEADQKQFNYRVYQVEDFSTTEGCLRPHRQRNNSTSIYLWWCGRKMEAVQFQRFSKRRQSFGASLLLSLAKH